MNTFNVVSVNRSEKKGTIKTPVPEISIDEQGVKGDAHAGKWHRQVSLLGLESIHKFEKQANRKIKYGEFAENITTQGIELYLLHPLDRISIGSTELEISQIGKKCHGESCAIFKEVGNCVMPKEGIFCRVLKGGTVKAGDEAIYQPKIFKIKIITLSDRAYHGEYDDLSGKRIGEMVTGFFTDGHRQCTIDYTVIPDDAGKLRSLLLEAKSESIDFVFTTGGTGIGPRDITPETVKPLLDKEIPGIMELIRLKYGQEKPAALLSRSIAGLMGKTFVFALPGSVKAVEEYFVEISKNLMHLTYMLNGLDIH